MNTLFIGTFRYGIREFILRFNFEIKDYPDDAAIWMFTEGNYACDCNRSLFIRQQFVEDAILSPLYFIRTLVKDLLTIYVCVYF